MQISNDLVRALLKVDVVVIFPESIHLSRLDYPYCDREVLDTVAAAGVVAAAAAVIRPVSSSHNSNVIDSVHGRSAL